VAQRRELDPKRRLEIVHDIQRYVADKAYYVYLPSIAAYLLHPPQLKGFKPHDGYGLGPKLMFTWLDR
jgi:ABC-type transport system substrate-binding protein